jgi:phosphoserine aminotransferase
VPAARPPALLRRAAGRRLPVASARSIGARRPGFLRRAENIGPAGVTLVFVRDDLLGRAPVCPGFDYTLRPTSRRTTRRRPTDLPPAWSSAGKGQGGVAEEGPRAKATCCTVIDDRRSRQPVARGRSRMNVPFSSRRIPNDAFLAGAREAGLLQLKGHKSVGGMRASIYNAMPLAGVQALVGYMQDFARRHG